jgi:phage head maturation protease
MKHKTVMCQSIGVPLPECLAREVDALVKRLPKDCKYKRQGAVSQAAELVKGERASIDLISAETVDRDNEVVLAKGMDFSYFTKNPVVTLSHKYDELPVGRAAWVKRVEGGIKAKTIFSEATEIARACWQMTQEGILKGRSVGFLPTKIRSATQEEMGRHPEWKDASCIIESAILIEYAVCVIPVNQDAIVEAVAKGTISNAILKQLGFPLPKRKKHFSQGQIEALVSRELDRLIPLLTPERIREKVLEAYRV